MSKLGKQKFLWFYIKDSTFCDFLLFFEFLLLAQTVITINALDQNQSALRIFLILYLIAFNICPTVILGISNRKYKRHFVDRSMVEFEEMKVNGSTVITQQKIYFGILVLRLLSFIFISCCYLFDVDFQGIKTISSLNFNL